MNDLIKNPEVDEQVQALSSSSSDLVTRAKEVTITDDASDAQAKEMLVNVATTRKRWKDIRDGFVKPIKDHANKMDAFFKAQAAPVNEAEGILKGKIGDYFTAQELAAKKELDRQMALAAKRQQTADRKAQESGHVAAAPVAVPIPLAPVKTTATANGSTTVKTVKRFRVVDETAIPREYLMVDMTKLGAVIKAGVNNIPGIQVYEEKLVAVR